MSSRYAIYYLPEPKTALWQFGSSLLGYDSIQGRELRQPLLGSTSQAQLREWTLEPRRYGFHATLKAPFRLIKGATEQDLCDRAEAHFSRESEFDLGRLALHPIGDFLALAPAEVDDVLMQFAGRCVEVFDVFRAPMTASERERRLKSRLDDRQLELLDRWGYPYVFEEFRFHMTLTGPVSDGARQTLARDIESVYERVQENVIVSSACICVQTAPSENFRLLRRFFFSQT